MIKKSLHERLADPVASLRAASRTTWSTKFCSGELGRPSSRADYGPRASWKCSMRDAWVHVLIATPAGCSGSGSIDAGRSAIVLPLAMVATAGRTTALS